MSGSAEWIRRPASPPSTLGGSLVRTSQVTGLRARLIGCTSIHQLHSIIQAQMRPSREGGRRGAIRTLRSTREANILSGRWALGYPRDGAKRSRRIPGKGTTGIFDRTVRARAWLRPWLVGSLGRRRKMPGFPSSMVDFPARAFYPLSIPSSMSRQRSSECLLPDRGRSGLQPHWCGRQVPCDWNLPGDRPATASPSAP